MSGKKKKRIKSHVKRLQLQQKKNPMSKEKYKAALRKARRKDFFRVIFRIIITLCVIFLVLFAAVNVWLKKTTGETLFDCMKEAQQVVAESTADDFRMAETSYIYSDDGTQLAGLSEDLDATYLTYDQIPENVINSFVAVEDRTFWTNGGIDYKGIARVCLNYVKSRGQVKEGASTITQQLARAKFLSNKKTMLRKIKEIFIARELTRKYSKKQIMEFYCNTCCFANGIYGVEDASQAYFGLPVSQLDLSQTAYICSIPNRPEYYNPYYDSKNALTRRDKILDDMYECGYITSSAKEEAKSEKMAVKEKKDDEEFYNYEVTYAINCAVRYLMKLDGFEFETNFSSDSAYSEYMQLYDEAYKQAKHKLYTGGYKITTTINLDAQKKMQEVLDSGLDFNTGKDDSTGIYKLQGAMTVIDNETGKVVAIIGGREQEELKNTYSLNRAFQSFRQPGSSFKPIAVYAPALDNGYYATSQLKNIDVSAAKNSTSAKVSNMYGSSMSMRYAVEQSKNGCAYWLFNALGPKKGLSYVTAMNFARIAPSDYTLSASLGGLTYGVTTVEMANAYSTLENHGSYTQTDCIQHISDSNGNEIYNEPESKQVYSQDAADSMTDILMGVLKRGTAQRLNWSSSSDVEAAGKTGTTNDQKDGWFCGYTPYYTISVWVGYDTPTYMSDLWGNTYPASIWKEAMLAMLDGKSAASFDIQKSYYNSNRSYSSGSGSEDNSGKDNADNADDKTQQDKNGQDDTNNTNGTDSSKKDDSQKTDNKKQPSTGDDNTDHIDPSIPDNSNGTDDKNDTKTDDNSSSSNDKNDQKDDGGSTGGNDSSGDTGADTNASESGE